MKTLDHFIWRWKILTAVPGSPGTPDFPSVPMKPCAWFKIHQLYFFWPDPTTQNVWSFDVWSYLIRLSFLVIKMRNATGEKVDWIYFGRLFFKSIPLNLNMENFISQRLVHPLIWQFILTIGPVTPGRPCIPRWMKEQRKTKLDF